MVKHQRNLSSFDLCQIRRTSPETRRVYFGVREVKQRVQAVMPVSDTPAARASALDEVPIMTRLELHQMIRRNAALDPTTADLTTLVETSIRQCDAVEIIAALTELSECATMYGALLESGHWQDKDTEHRFIEQTIQQQTQMCQDALHHENNDSNDALSLQSMRKLVWQELETTRTLAAGPHANDAVHDRLKDLERRDQVLAQAVDREGGWRSVLFMANGDMDTDIDLTIWSEQDQIEILNLLLDHHAATEKHHQHHHEAHHQNYRGHRGEVY